MKTKVTTTANHNKGLHHQQPMSTQSETQIRETRENAGDQVTIGFRLHLIG